MQEWRDAPVRRRRAPRTERCEDDSLRLGRDAATGRAECDRMSRRDRSEVGETPARRRCNRCSHQQREGAKLLPVAECAIRTKILCHDAPGTHPCRPSTCARTPSIRIAHHRSFASTFSVCRPVLRPPVARTLRPRAHPRRNPDPSPTQARRKPGATPLQRRCNPLQPVATPARATDNGIKHHPSIGPRAPLRPSSGLEMT